MFIDADYETFRRAEKVMGDVKSAKAKRGRYSHAKRFVTWVAKEGVDNPAFTNIGRWRTDEAATRGAAVFIPWLTIDIDSQDLVEAHEDAAQTLRNLEAIGYDLTRTIASFSGNKGFHIQVDARQMGLAPFASPKEARVFITTWTMDVCDGNFWDSAVTSPRSLIRITGSKHASSGLYKRSFTGKEFLGRGLHEVMSNVRGEYKGFEWPDHGRILPGPRSHLRRLIDDAERRYRGKKIREGGRKSSSSGIVSRIKEGVMEGQEFGPRNFHVGRENAAFIMGCALLEQTESERVAREKLNMWNGLNKPPLPQARLRAQFRGAKRKMNHARR